jgi:F-type H+-transporting ATPase subunit b
MAQAAQSTPSGTTQTEVGQDGGAHSNFPPFDPSTFPSQLVWLAIAFGLLYRYMSKRGLPQLGAVIDERKARIARDLDDATTMQQKADAAAGAHEKTLAEARAKAQALAQAARDAAAADAQAKRQALEDELAAKLAAAEREIAATRAQAMASVAEVARDAAGAIVERLGGRSADPAAVAAAVRSVEQLSGAA